MFSTVYRSGKELVNCSTIPSTGYNLNNWVNSFEGASMRWYQITAWSMHYLEPHILFTTALYVIVKGQLFALAYILFIYPAVQLKGCTTLATFYSPLRKVSMQGKNQWMVRIVNSQSTEGSSIQEVCCNLSKQVTQVRNQTPAFKVNF